MSAFIDRLRARRRGDRAPERWVVVDTETTGLDAERDTLLAIGAVAVDASGVRPGDSFEALLRNDRGSDRANILVHGIGRQAQATGVPAASVLPAFVAYVDGAPCIGFHAEFDRRVIVRAFANAALAGAPPRWLDVGVLACALAPDGARRAARSLDDWLVDYGIRCIARHHAAADALATAELLLRVRAQAAAVGVHGFDALRRLARQQRWLGHAV